MYKMKINILLIGIIVIIVLVTTFQTVSATVTWPEYYDVTAGQAFTPPGPVPNGNTVRVTAHSTLATGGEAVAFTWHPPSGGPRKTSTTADGSGNAQSTQLLNLLGDWGVDVKFSTGGAGDTGTSEIITVVAVPEFPYGIAILIFSSSLTYLVMRKWRKPR